MTWLNLAEFAQLASGRLHLISELEAANMALERVERDSRAVQQGDVFLALKGERFDAHDFVAQVAGKASAALVSHAIEAPIPQVIVPDVRLALGELAKAWRARFSTPVVGLTGSNGKTTLKEMLTSILALQGKTLATAGNLNNDIGMPLTLLGLRAEHQFAVIEMGANHFGEIDYLTKIARPNVAILNNAGAAHLEGFGDIAGVARAKGEIFAGLMPNGVAIINADDIYADYWFELNKKRPIIRFGLQHEAEVSGYLNAANHLVIQAYGEQVEVDLKLLGQHNRLNALAATAAALALKLPLTAIASGLAALQAVKGRLNPVQGTHGGVVIDDTYNANPSSMAAAVKVLADFKGQTVFIMGDMAELGDTAANLHQAIGQQAKEAGIEYLVSLGHLSQAASQAFGENAKHFNELDLLVEYVKNILTPSSTVLVKGSRSARMERVVDALCTRSTAEVH
ncbi:UDP-N-acetylmuramoyl-tripeptide--D-alanyl-D-alanine ligase [Thiolinea disciformis]|uniref:UDP-N-acetylmuramoyl-tripeptide--D-alanyl-D- alanine ligase n=1 Tax=Thiolinea disciformis TaxID=125614 RepID=UPI00037114C9|nr:UDP-N-acetylmuramoyl-tripeptide--D-alanyl-D-alanine ligase [Thiolinea disciformis]